MKALVYSLASTAAGVACGLAIGGAGSIIPRDVRDGLATVLVLPAVILGGIELGGRRVQPIQCNRETPQRWIHLGPIRWAVLNGLALGCGTGSRLGFWLWYAVPVGALLFRSPITGAFVYGAYSFARGMAVWLLLLLALPRWPNEYAAWMIARNNVARAAAAGCLICVGVAVAIAVGF